jgi:WD40 repeat protein
VKVWDFTRHPEHATFARVRSRTDEQVKVRDLTGRADATTLARTGPDLEAIAFHADRRHLVSVAVGGKLQTWDAATGVLFRQQTIAMSDELVSPAVLAAFAPGGERLAARARGDDRLVRIWDTATGSELMALTGHTVPVYALQFSPDGRYLASCGCDVTRPGKPHEIIVWDSTTGGRNKTFTGQGLLFCVAFSHDGNRLAAGSDSGAVLLNNWKTSSQFQSLRGHTGSVAAVAFSTDDRLLASGGLEDRTVRVVDLGHHDLGNNPPANILPAPPFLCDLAFSPDGFRLAGISRDVVRLWDTRTFHEVIGLRGAPQRHWDPIFNPRIAFSPNGRRLVGSNWDESISMWDANIPADKDAITQWRDGRRLAADARAPAWHLQEAEVCHDHQNTTAARFHLQRLGQTPLPDPLRARKEQLIRLLDK